MTEPDEPARTARVRLTGQQRRREILAAAQAVFATSGLGGARTSQIAEAAGVAESMLYKHFSSKQELFEAAVAQPVAEFVQGVADSADGLLERDGPGSEKFYRSFLDTMTEVLPLLGVALFSDSEQGRRFYNESIVPLYDRFEDKIRSSLAAVPGAHVEAGLLARVTIGVMLILALDATYRPPAPSASPAGPAHRDDLADQVRSFIASALTGAGADDLLALLGELEARPPSAGMPPAPEMVTPADWSRFWALRREREARTHLRVQELSSENDTLRRILVDQAIELRMLRDRLGPTTPPPAAE